MPQRLDFKQIAQDIDITDVARLLGLKLSKDMRAECCDSDRALQIYPETNSFCCHSSKTAGDCISMYAHLKGYEGMYKAAKELEGHFRTTGSAVASTAPQAVRREPTRPTKLAKKESFNAETFAAKLSYSDEVKHLANEKDAEAFRVGFYRGHLYIPAVYPNGSIAGWWKLVDGKLVPPDKWLPDTSNVVPYRRPA